MAKILFVEDDADIRDLVRLALEDEHEILSTETAEDGLLQAAEHAPDIILMDISLGGAFDGLEAAGRLRADPRFDRTPVVALTAHAMPGIITSSVTATGSSSRASLNAVSPSSATRTR